ncbi:sigma-70 family RNA polymerase sigma factor [Dyadobacter sp. CY261]|uniref:RNA polymerase sigma factor n=1 Tax=Dyadobacter sp. CY261 TaxID=2907203 RepID=UPI001F3BB8A6|nr:sigma-70 family RNA polymerase sigma factor [Dyadobacter sp. CY261]MCF0072842.1 sigma-70 family RNA polymerase sigma factor [Dyadobacter sp. CY261]
MFNEKEVVLKIQHGDIKAFALLVNQYERLVFHVVHRLTLDQADAEDICQDVFLKVHNHLKMFAFQSKLSTWIARIAYLTAIDYLRKYRKMRTSELTDDLEHFHLTTVTPEQVLAEKDITHYVHQLIAQLPLQYRTVLTLYHLDEFSYPEIELITGMPEGTVKNYLFRARKLLKESVELYLKHENK